MWSIYLSEAERYDKALTQGWKDDMDGILIFVRSLTHFNFARRRSTFIAFIALGGPLLGQRNSFHNREL
jgi:hypothetical protein